MFLQFESCWRSAADCTKLGPLFTTKVGLAAKTPSCLLASRYSCYGNMVVKQRDGNTLENWVRPNQQKHSISFWLFALCRFHFINGKIWGCFFVALINHQCHRFISHKPQTSACASLICHHRRSNGSQYLSARSAAHCPHF